MIKYNNSRLHFQGLQSSQLNIINIMVGEVRTSFITQIKYIQVPT